MANRKQELDAAVANSKQEAAERTAAAKPQQAGSPAVNPGFKLPYTKMQEAAAAAPMHPRAAKGKGVRQRELDAGMAAGREQEQKLTAAGAAQVAEGKGVLGHKTKSVTGPKDTNRKVGVRQVSQGKGKVINSGTVVLGKDYDNYGATSKVEQVTANAPAAKNGNAKKFKKARDMRINKNIKGIRISQQAPKEKK